MPLNERDSELLMSIVPELHRNAMKVVFNLLPRLTHVLLPSDPHTIKNKADTLNFEWAVNDLLDCYKLCAKDLNPMADALRGVEMDELADKISRRSLPEGDLQRLRNATPVLMQDGDAKEIADVLFGEIFNQAEKDSILSENTERAKMTKLLGIYQSKALSLRPLIVAFSHTAQPHLAKLLENHQ